VEVPAPPQASFEKNSERERRDAAKTGAATVGISAASQRIAPLDAAFLGRVYRVNAIFGAILTTALGIWSGSVGAALSCAVGVTIGLLLLKTQELFVRRVIRPLTWPAYEGPDKKLPLWLIVPGKYALAAAAILLLRHTELLNYGAFAGGFAAVQMTLLSMALGRLMARRRSIREVYVQPHVARH